MTKIKIDTEGFRVLSIFERVTKVNPKDCLIADDSIYFLVDPDKVGLAIGKSGANVKKASQILNKEVRIFEYSSDPSILLKNFIPTAENVEVSGTTVKFTIPQRSRFIVIGKAGKNINMIKEFMERHCGITDLKFR